MPLPTPPNKLGNLLPPDEFKAKARPAKNAKKQGIVGEQAEAAEFGTTSGSADIAEPVARAANSATTLRSVQTPVAFSSNDDVGASVTRSRKSKQTAALLQPVPTPLPVARQEEPAGDGRSAANIARGAAAREGSRR